jgi:hypothetical protein
MSERLTQRCQRSGIGRPRGVTSVVEELAEPCSLVELFEPSPAKELGTAIAPALSATATSSPPGFATTTD